MAKRRRSGGSSSIVARAEGWYGVSHNVPRRGTAAHRAMVSKYMRAHPAVRHNPITTQRERRVLHPENCSAETTQRLLAKRKAEGRAGVKHKTSRIGNCDYRSASYALAHHTGGGGGSLASRILPWWPSSK